MRNELASAPRARGFTLIEVTIAGFLLLAVALGVLPIFTQSLASNQAGADSTQVSNMSRSRVEEMLQLPFNSPQLAITDGTELVTNSYYSAHYGNWNEGEPPEDGSDPALWLLTTTIRQYAISALDDGKVEAAEALPAGTLESFVHLKEIEVAAVGTRLAGPLGPSKRITLRMYKAQ